MVLESFAQGEEHFYENVVNELSRNLKANCFIIKSKPGKTLKIYPGEDPEKVTVLNYVKLPNAQIIENATSIKEILQLEDPQSLFDMDKNSKVLIKTVKSFNYEVSALIVVLRKKEEKDFDDDDEKLIEKYIKVLSIPLSLFEADNKVKVLSKKNSVLNKLASYNFPNDKANLFATKKHEQIPAVYFAMDIRQSTAINEYLVERGGVNEIIEFYNYFKDYCDNIAVEKYNAWFRRQVGDKMEYAWKKRDHKRAILAAIEIFDNLDKLRRKTKIPISIGVGIGVSSGDVWPDYEINELKGDPPRIANALQEKHHGIYLDYKPRSDIAEQIESLGWAVLEKSLIARDKIITVWEVRKQNRRKINLIEEDTIERMRFAGRLSGDMHVHLEGSDLRRVDFVDLFESSVKVINREDSTKLNLEKITNQKLEDIVDNFVAHLSNEDPDKFSFQEFLTKMYSTKIILSSNYLYPKEFLKKVLKSYFNKYNRIRLGVTPSIPIDFPHLQKRRWSNTIYHALEEALDNSKNKEVELVLETKRQHLDQKTEGSFVFESNLEFLQNLYERGHSRISFSLSVCDDASMYPLFNNKRFENFEKYIDIISDYNDISLSLHMLETLPDLANVDKNLVNTIKKNPLYELELVLDLLGRKGFRGTNWVHMSNIFEGIEYRSHDRASRDNKKLQRGIRYLETMIERNDRIVVCFSSNEALKNPVMLFYPEVLELLLTGRLNIVLGTDDPGPFKVKDVTEELGKIAQALTRLYPDGLEFSFGKLASDELVLLTKFVLVRNSWREWDYSLEEWKDPVSSEIAEKFKYDESVIANLLAFDLVPDIKKLQKSTTRKQLIKRERENVFGV